MDLLADADEVRRELFGGVGGEAGGAAGFAVCDVALHTFDADFTGGGVLGGCGRESAVHVQGHDVAGNGLIAAGVVGVLDDEDHVETGENGGLEVNVLAGGFHVIVAAEDGVCSGEDRGASVEDGGDTGFGN